MKKASLILSLTLFCFFVGMTDRASAGSVNLYNPWWWKGEITLCSVTLTGAEDCSSKQTVAGDQTAVFSIVGGCAKSLSGYFSDVYQGGKTVRIALQAVNVATGQDISNPSDGTPSCQNSSWKICRKRGTQGDPTKDNDFGFCKQ